MTHLCHNLLYVMYIIYINICHTHYNFDSQAVRGLRPPTKYLFRCKAHPMELFLFGTFLVMCCFLYIYIYRY